LRVSQGNVGNVGNGGVVLNWNVLELLNWDSLNVLNDWLLNNLLDDWLLNNLLDDWLLDNLLLDWLVDDLSFNSLVFNSFLDSFNWNVFSVSVLIDLGNIFSLVFDGVVVGNSSFSGNVFSSGNSFVFIFNSFERNIFNSGFSSDSWGGGDCGDGSVRDWGNSGSVGYWGRSV